jgi:hypothetical protein
MYFGFHDQRLLALAVCWVAGALASGVAIGQTGDASGSQLSIRQGNIRQTSLDDPFPVNSDSLVDARREASGGGQIRVIVQYLLVDSETRARIYAGIEPERLVRTANRPVAMPRPNLQDSSASVSSRHELNAPSRVTSCTLSEGEFSNIMKLTMEAGCNQINVAPKIILLEGNEAEMNDVVQRPFVVDFEVQDNTLKPTVQVMEEGTQLRLLAQRTNPQADSGTVIDLKCELTIFRVLEIQSDQVFGLKSEPLNVQIPIQQIKSSLASGQLSAGQVLMIDPHCSQTGLVQNDKAVPVLSKIPYLNRTFKNTSVASVQQHLVLVLQPSIEPINR